MLFKKNDIVRLKNEYFEKIKSDLFFSENLFFIDKCSERVAFVTLRNVDFTIPLAEICPVKMDGVEDRNIYYDPMIAADVIALGETAKSHQADKDGYYIEQLKKCRDEHGKSLYDIVQSCHCVYVHELQHANPSIGRDLKINYTVAPFIEQFPSKVKLGLMATMMTYNRYAETEKKWNDYIKVYVTKEIRVSKMAAFSFPIKKPAYVLLFEGTNRYEARYAEFYINSSIGKIFLLKDLKEGKLEGNATLASLKSLQIRWVDGYKTSCVCLESLIQVINVYESSMGKEQPALTGLLGFLTQLRDAMVMEMMMPKLFKKANFSVLEKWKRDADAIMLDFYHAEDDEQRQITLIGDLIKVITADNNGIMSEMAKYRVYMLEFIRFAEQNKAEL